MFNSEDEKLIAEMGVSMEMISAQLERFNKGIDPVNLDRAAVVGDGIKQFSFIEKKDFEKRFDVFRGTISKFVPASGAATRMFKELLAFRNDHEGSSEACDTLVSNRNSVEFTFFNHLDSFAFYNDLGESFKKEHGSSLEESHLKKEYTKILSTLLTEPGLNYGKLPKGLLKFHKYENESRTPVEEQLAEGWGHKGLSKNLNVHFTVSPEYLDHFSGLVNEIKKRSAFGDQIKASFSTQEEHTDTIAVDQENKPVRDEKGQLLFRPAGHGALLENLNEIGSDIIFIKNIDNILPEHLKPESVFHKKVLGGVLIYYQKKIFHLLSRSEQGQDIEEEGLSLLGELGVSELSTKDEVVKYLNRPIRVCGMVRNQGEPGGGPFWVKRGGQLSLQVVESAQVKKQDADQTRIFENSTHFNPVDLVCGMKNYKGEKFDLIEFRDPELAFISSKTYAGRPIKALELPGLWNGSMAYWNTIFVEVPVQTFSPVKSVNDLLKREHQPS